VASYSGTIDLGTSLTNFNAATSTLTGGTYAVHNGGKIAFASASIATRPDSGSHAR